MLLPALYPDASMQHERSSPVVWTKWHRERQDARENAMSPEEFSPQERDAFDLDDAGVTGEDNPRTYSGEDVLGEPWWRG